MTRRTLLRASLLLALVIAVSAAWNVGGPPVSDLMEVRNLVTAREMVDTGRWVLPTMNGELRIAKPPLPTWAAAASGAPSRFTSLWAMRLPTLAFALLGAMATVVYARRLGLSDTYALWAGLILVTMFLYARQARLATWDMPVHACAMAAVAAFAEAVARRRTSLIVLAAAFVVASFLSKWPQSLGVLVLPWIVTTAIVFRPLLAARRSDVLWLAVLTVAGCAAWPAYVYLHEPQSLALMLARETDALVTRHVRPVWAYGGFPILTGAWLPLVLAALSSPIVFKDFFARREVRATYYWLWLAFVIASAVPSKKERYLMPLIFPMALLVAAWCEQASRSARPAAVRVLRAHLWCLGAAGGAALLAMAVLAGIGRISPGEAVVAGAFVSAGLAGFAVLVRSGRPLIARALTSTLVLAACVMAAGWHVQHRLEPADLPPPQLRGALASTLAAADPLFAPDPVDIHLVWAAGRPVRPHLRAAGDFAAVRPFGRAATAGWISTDPPQSDRRLLDLRAEGIVIAADHTQRWATTPNAGWLYYSRLRIERR